MSKLRRRSRGFLSNFVKPAKKRRAYRRLMPEQLENRLLLAADFHNFSNPLDVSNDFNVTAIDALMVINELNSDRQSSAEGENQRGYFDVNGDGDASSIDALMVINALNAEGEGATTFNISAVPLAGVSLLNVQSSGTNVLTSFTGWTGFNAGDPILVSDAIDSAGNIANGFYTISAINNNDLTLNNPHGLTNFFGQVNVAQVIDQIGTNSDFVLGIVAEDLTSDGPFAVFADITFDSTLASVTSLDITGTPNPESPTENFKFNSFVNGKSGDFETTPGLIDEAGAFRPAGGGLLRGPHLAFTVDMQTGGQPGNLNLGLGASGIIQGEDPNGVDFPSGLPAHDVLVNGSNVPVCQIIRTTNLPNDTPPCTGMVMYNSVSLAITSDITALPDSGQVDENAGPIFINVLANDSISVGTGPTITNPIPTTSANGATVQQSGPNGFNYTPATNFAGTDTFAYTITNGSSNASADVTVTVNAINDPPVISGPTSLSTNEDTTANLSGFSIIDPDSNNITVTLSANGTLSQTSFSGTPSQVTSTLNSVTYTPITNSTASDTINISASDGNLSDSHTVNITINAINDPPVNTFPGTGPTSLFNTETLSFTGIQVSDVDASTLEVTLDVSQGTLSISAGGLTVQGNNSTSLTATGSISNLNTALNSLLYDPTDTFIGDDTLTMTTSDLGATGGGGTQTDVDTVTLSVAPPQVPFAANDSFSADEGAGSFVLSPNPLDNDLRDSGATLNVTSVITANAQGSLSFSNSNFTYTPPTNPDFFGTETFTYTILQDPAPSSTGDTSDTGTIVIEIVPINDGPVNSLGGSPISTSPTVTGSEDNTLSFSGTNGLSISDIDAGTGDVTVTLTVNSGTLNVTNTGGVQGNSSGQLTIDGTVSQVNSALGGLTYSPQTDFFGNDALVINTNDNGNTGATALSDNDTVNITIAPVNDAPTLVVPGKQTLFTDFDNRFSSDPAPFSIADVDAGTSDVQVDLTIGDGTLTISSTSGVTVTQNPGGSNGIRISGSVSNVNNALASGVDYRSSVPAPDLPNNPNPKTLNVVVNDLGNTGSGNQLTASAAVEVEVLDFVPVDIIGQVFVDDDGDGQKGSSEPAIGGIDVILSGTDFQGNTVSLTKTTDSRGVYEFTQLKPNQPDNPYTITQEQPVFIQNNQGTTNTAQLELDINGNVLVTDGSLSFGEGGFAPEFADVWRLFALSEQAPNNSGIIFGMQGSQDWSMFVGPGWNMDDYSNPRFTSGADGNSGVLTVFDSQASVDRTANVSTQAGTLTYRGTGSDRVYRVTGDSSLLGTNGVGNPEGESDSSDSHTAAVDSVIASLFAN